jgi:olefin beta-lactone synthetase
VARLPRGAARGPAADGRGPDPVDLRRWGLDPAWSRRVRVTPVAGPSVDWHVLDTGEGPQGTIVCVHGNPTWGYLWRDFLTHLAPGWRVIAVDQTGMGWSERTPPRRLAERVAELVAFCVQETTGPLVLVAHDWGGPIALGAAAELPVRAVILGNTGVAKPAGVAVPPLIAAARRMVDLVCRRTPAFVAGTARMTAPEHRDALRAPYRSAARRAAVADFVADIPLDPADPSWAALQRSADTLAGLAAPLLLVWGGRDPVFHDRFLADLVARAPRADVHRFAGAGHLVPLDAPMAEVAAAWLDRVLAPGASGPPDVGVGSRPDDAGFRPVTAALAERADDEGLAYAGPDGTVSWRDLAARSELVAQHLVGSGMGPGARVALLVPPGADLLVATYGIWRAGGTVVVADAGLGPLALRRALRGATPTWAVGTPRTLLASRALGLAPGARRAALGRWPGAVDLTGRTVTAPARLPDLAPDWVAAVVHTSGATGPAKPVRYTHGALAVQRDVVASSFAMSAGEAFTTSFAPFVVLGPALGVPCVLPDIDVRRPADLDHDRLAAACARAPVGVAWLSPASARRVVATAAGRTVALRLVMLAGAPIDADLVRAVGAVTGADVRSPYGMTEAMPLTDGVDPARAGPLGGTATGWLLPGSEVAVVPLDNPRGARRPPGEWGELLIAAPWMRAGYDRRWATDAEATVIRDGRAFHRTGDVGYLAADGCLFQLGRVQHVLHPATGPVASVAVEQPVAAAIGRSVAAVGVGPVGTQAVVIVVDGPGRLRLAEPALTATVRRAGTDTVAAVLEGPLPIDIRHQSKVDRTSLAGAAAAVLAGR